MLALYIYREREKYKETVTISSMGAHLEFKLIKYFSYYLSSLISNSILFNNFIMTLYFQIYKAVLKWTRHNLDNRKKMLPQLLPCIRYELLSEVSRIIIFEITYCFLLIIFVLFFMSDPISNTF